MKIEDFSDLGTNSPDQIKASIDLVSRKWMESFRNGGFRPSDKTKSEANFILKLLTGESKDTDVFEKNWATIAIWFKQRGRAVLSLGLTGDEISHVESFLEEVSAALKGKDFDDDNSVLDDHVMIVRLFFGSKWGEDVKDVDVLDKFGGFLKKKLIGSKFGNAIVSNIGIGKLMKF